MKGFTLIETIIYIALLTILIGTSVVATFYIIDSSQKNSAAIMKEAEITFLSRKFHWLISNNATITSPLPNQDATKLTVTKNNYTTNPLMLDLALGRIRLSEANGASLELNSQRINVSSLSFHYNAPAAPQPASIQMTMTIDGKQYSYIEYISL